ncbi:hypothetical protein [Phocaeicola sp.]
MENKYVVLLTACVDPKGMSYTYLVDNNVRKQQYMTALFFYLQKTSYPIVFCENTLCDFSNLFVDYVNIGRLEYLTFDGNNFDKSKGKGYGEVEILEYAFNNSYFLKDADMVVKITGRLQCVNINFLLKVNRLIVCPVIQTNYISGKNKMMDSKIVIAPADFFKDELISRKKMLNDSIGVFFEHILFLSICEQKRYIFLPFVIIPNIIGQSGSTGTVYVYVSKRNYAEKLSYIYYSLSNGLRLNNEYMKMKYSYNLLGSIQIVRFFIKLLLGIVCLLQRIMMRT